jgi:hypothetical protein
VYMAGRIGKQATQRGRTIRRTARGLEIQKWLRIQEQDNQVFDRTYNTLRRSRELLQRTEKLLQQLRAVCEGDQG